MPDPTKMRVTVLVLGDVGRSPRMQYHALALASSLAAVDLVGYADSPAPRAVREHPGITCHLVPASVSQPSQGAPRAFLTCALFKVIRQSFHLLWVLLYEVQRPDFLLVQNPPALPTLVLAQFIAWVRSAKLVIDWHNFGYSMLALKVGHGHPIVRLARWYEQIMGRLADAHLCVSRAMQTELAEQWGIPDATVLYDCPAEQFAPISMRMRDALFRRLRDEGVLFGADYCPTAPDRPALIVSSSSWTADEDFSLLLDAVVQWDALIDAHAEEPKGRLPSSALIVLTGKGPLRASYEDRMKQLTLHHIRLHTAWLSAEDYPVLLGAADLGLCLHRSSSGLDLPMKIADMFGVGLPVCALDYGPCLAELVRHGENGLLFTSSTQLADQLHEVFANWPTDTRLLHQLGRNVVGSGRRRWIDEWREHALPVFADL